MVKTSLSFYSVCTLFVQDALSAVSICECRIMLKPLDASYVSNPTERVAMTPVVFIMSVSPAG